MQLQRFKALLGLPGILLSLSLHNAFAAGLPQDAINQAQQKAASLHNTTAFQQMVDDSKAHAAAWKPTPAFDQLVQQSVTMQQARRYLPAQIAAQMHDSQDGAGGPGAEAGGRSERPNPNVIVFVSLSMPVTSIRQIVFDAHRFGVPVILRGLYQDNWVLTANTVYKIVHPDNAPALSGGIGIDPLWFREYGIVQVPAVVAIKPGTACMPQDKSCVPEFDVVYGNIPLQQSLELIAERGTEAKSVAANLLNQQGGAH